jgi:hypothetical protein
MHKNLKGFDVAKCRTIDKAMSNEFDNYFPLGPEAILDVELPIQSFIEALSLDMMLTSLHEKQDKIKIKFIIQNKTQWKMPMYACPMSLTNPHEVLPTKPTSWNKISKCMFFVLGGQHIAMTLMIIPSPTLLICVRCNMI